MLHKINNLNFINKTFRMNQDKHTEQHHVKFHSCIFITTRALGILSQKYATKANLEETKEKVNTTVCLYSQHHDLLIVLNAAFW